MARSTVKPSAVAIIDADPTPAVAVSAPVPSAAVAVRSAVGIDAVPTFAHRADAIAASGTAKAIPVYACTVIVDGAPVLEVSATASTAAALVESVRTALDTAGNYGNAVLGALAFGVNAKGNPCRIVSGAEKGLRSAANRAYHAVAFPAIGVAVGLVRIGFVSAE